MVTFDSVRHARTHCSASVSMVGTTRATPIMREGAGWKEYKISEPSRELLRMYSRHGLDKDIADRLHPNRAVGRAQGIGLVLETAIATPEWTHWTIGSSPSLPK